MVIRTAGLTYADLEGMPEDGNRYELIDGELIVSPAPATPHQRTFGELFYRFYGHVRQTGEGEVFAAPFDVLLSEGNVVEPDIFFIAGDWARIVGQRNVQGVPDLVIEILSPSSRTYDTIRKALLYARAGVREYWLVDPERRAITVYALVDCRYEEVPPVEGRARSLVLPRFEVDPLALFAVLD